jgi:hypothetical protein
MGGSPLLLMTIVRAFLLLGKKEGETLLELVLRVATTFTTH